MASLLVISGPHEGDYFPLPADASIVGRGDGCAIQIIDRTMSREHVEISYARDADRYQVRDLGSANGVFVNDQPVEEHHHLADCDVIRLGRTELMYSDVNFSDPKAALEHYRKQGEQDHSTSTYKF